MTHHKILPGMIPDMTPRTIKRTEQTLSPWVRLVERTVSDGSNEAVYHSFAQSDYVCMVAATVNNELVCVSQYRPAVDAVTLELPAGLLEADEDPLQCAVRELHEEAHLRPGAPPLLLGRFFPDTGRLENRFWAYAARDVVPVADAINEPNMARHLIPLADVAHYIADGRFANALHIAAIGLAMMRGVLPMFDAGLAAGTAGGSVISGAA
jgi:ADP-ribose pyrophosphatase